MSIFHFKQFVVSQAKSAMKIGTDSVLLGCMCKSNKAATALDIGTGTGLLALMLAQKCHARIDAIEIDEQAANEALGNFSASKWRSKLKLHHTSLQGFNALGQYDIIISNPPYFRHKQQYKVEDLQRSRARHDQDLPFEELAQQVQKLLSIDGNFWCILPSLESTEFITICQSVGLQLSTMVRIIPKRGKTHNRVIMCFRKAPVWKVAQSDLTIYEENGLPTDEYKEITYAYYLWKGDDTSVDLKW